MWKLFLKKFKKEKDGSLMIEYLFGFYIAAMLVILIAFLVAFGYMYASSKEIISEVSKTTALEMRGVQSGLDMTQPNDQNYLLDRVSLQLHSSKLPLTQSIWVDENGDKLTQEAIKNLILLNDEALCLEKFEANEDVLCLYSTTTYSGGTGLGRENLHLRFSSGFTAFTDFQTLIPLRFNISETKPMDLATPNPNF